MRKADVLAHFADNQSAVARAIGIKRASVNQWGPVVPLDKALRLQEATKESDRPLRVDLSLYEGTPEKALVDFGRSAARSRRHVNA
jgi:hypothetical protein